MKYKDFQHQLDELLKDISILDVYSSPDFQCDQTDGIPTKLCVVWSKGKAWLEPNKSMIEECDEHQINRFMEECADFGIRDCESKEEFNALLKELGDEAFEVGELVEDELFDGQTEEQEGTIKMGGI